jgi:hypothetical protein
MGEMCGSSLGGLFLWIAGAKLSTTADIGGARRQSVRKY